MNLYIKIIILCSIIDLSIQGFEGRVSTSESQKSLSVNKSIDTSMHESSKYLEVQTAKKSSITKSNELDLGDISSDEPLNHVDKDNLKSEGVHIDTKEAAPRDSYESEAQTLESQARSAKNSQDVRSIIAKIDVKNIFPKVLVDWLVEASDYWMSKPFNFDTFFNWVTVVGKFRDNMPEPFEDVTDEDITDDLIPSAKEELEKEGIPMDSSKTELSASGMSYDQSADLVSIENEQIAHEANEEPVEKLLIVEEEPKQSIHDDSVAKRDQAYQDIQTCIDKMIDIHDEEPISHLFDTMSLAVKNLDPQGDKKVIDAINYFESNKEALIKSPLGFAVFHKSELVQHKNNLPKPSRPLTEQQKKDSQKAFLNKLKNDKSRVDKKNKTLIS